MSLRKLALASAVAIMASTAAQACQISARVSVVGNEFPAIQTVGKGAQACSGAEVSTNLTADHQKINVAGMSGNPAEYTSAIIANSSIVALMNNDVIRPLDDLVAKHGKDLKKNQLITINGKVMAVAFMANAQHLVYREDVLKKIGMRSHQRLMKICWRQQKKSGQPGSCRTLLVVPIRQAGTWLRNSTICSLVMAAATLRTALPSQM